MKKFSKTTAIVLSVILFVCLGIGFVLSFVPIQFSKSKYVSFWNTMNVSTDMAGGMYGEYTITTENPSEKDIVDTVSLIREVFEEDGYKNVNVYATGSSKVRVELSYPNGDESISDAYSRLTNIGAGAFSLRSSSSTTSTTEDIVLEGSKYVKEVKVYTNNDSKYISIVFNKEGQVKYEELCTTVNASSGSIYLFLGDYSQSISVTGATDFSSLTLSNTDWNNMISLEQKIKLGCAKVELDGTNAKIDTMSTTMSAGESSSSPEDKTFFSSNIYVVSMATLIVVAVLLVSFFAINYGFFALVAGISMMFNAYLFLFIAWLVPSFELSVSVLFALSVGLALIYVFAYDYARNVKSEYNLGKSLAASLESSRKRTLPSVIICGLTLLASSLVLMALSFSEITSVAIAFAICSALLLFTNIVMIPFFVKIGISFNKFDRKLFLLKKKRSLAELSASSNKEEN